MTRYLIGQSVASDPFLNIYEANDVGTTPPVRLGFKPGIIGPVANLKFSQKQKELALVVNARREEVPGIGNAGTAIVGLKVFSPEDNYVLVGGDASNIAQLYYRRGPYYLPIAAANVPLPTTAGVYVTAAALSNNGNVLAFVTSDAPTIIKLCDKTTDATTGLDHWTARTSLTAVANVTVLKVSPDSLYVVYDAGANPGRVYKLISNVYTDVSRSGANPITSSIQRSDGNLYVIEKSATQTVAGAVYKYDGTTWTLVLTLQLTTTSLTSSSGYIFSADGNSLIYSYIRSAASTADLIAVYYWTGTTFAKVTPLTPVTTPRWPTNTRAIISADGSMVAVSFFSIGASPQQQTVRLYSIAAGVYTLLHEWVIGTTTGIAVQNFSPDKSVLHLGNGASNGQHFSTSTFLELTSLPEAPGVAANTVYSVIYGNVGQASFALTSSTTIPAIRDGKGAYLDARTLEGTFVSLYDRKTGTPDYFQERTFVQHLLGTVVSDIVFSPDSKVLLYHTQRPGVTDQTGLGRFVYDISIGTFMTYKGAIYLASDDASFAAVNASSSYFVVCFENASLGDNIRLYKLSSTFTYTDIDHHLVDFGPVAFSVCETVVVAHGGDTPYTLYSHVTTPTDSLVLQPISFTDWEVGSDVLAVAFTPDCDGVVLVTPDEIIIDDTDTGVPADEAPQDTPTDEPPTIEPDPDDPTKMVVVPRNHDGSSQGSNGGGAGGVTGINVPAKTVDKFEYTPYVAINITYRTW